MMKFTFTASDVKKLATLAFEGDRPAAHKHLIKTELLSEIDDARENHDPGRLADVLEYMVERLL